MLNVIKNIKKGELQSKMAGRDSEDHILDQVLLPTIYIIYIYIYIYIHSIYI